MATKSDIVEAANRWAKGLADKTRKAFVRSKTHKGLNRAYCAVEAGRIACRPAGANARVFEVACAAVFDLNAAHAAASDRISMGT